MRICYFGYYDPAYNRNRVLIRGLRESGAEVVECRSEKSGIAGLRELAHKHRELGAYDILLVGHSASRGVVFFGRLIAQAPVVWDAFYSLYENRIYDRALLSRWSPKAVALWMLEWCACRLARVVLIDTAAHAAYFKKLFFVPAQKIHPVFVGADETLFRPELCAAASSGKIFTVGFIGNYIPLQGVEHIVDAARALSDERDIQFVLLGSGQTYARIVERIQTFGLSNVTLVPKVPYDMLPRKICSYDVVLGIFGGTGKAHRVIPNKVYEAIAMRKPVITADTPAIRELFTDGENIALCKVADGESLASKIIELKENPAMRERIARGGYEVFQKHATPEMIGERVISILNRMIQ